VATWLTTYGSSNNTNRLGRADLNHLAVVFVAQQGTDNYTILGLPDAPNVWYDLSPRSAPYSSQASAAAAAASLFDVSGWIPVFGAFGASYPGWLNPALIAQVETAGSSASGGFYLCAQVSAVGSAYDVSDRAQPFATEAAAIAAIDGLFADPGQPTPDTPYAPISMTVTGGQLTAKGRNLVVSPGNGNFLYGYAKADQRPVSYPDPNNPGSTLTGRINCALAWTDEAILPWDDPAYVIQVEVTVRPAATG
jgi:hypothetical protein